MRGQISVSLVHSKDPHIARLIGPFMRRARVSRTLELPAAERAPGETKQAWVYRCVRDLILSGALRRGDRLPASRRPVGKIRVKSAHSAQRLPKQARNLTVDLHRVHVSSTIGSPSTSDMVIVQSHAGRPLSTGTGSGIRSVGKLPKDPKVRFAEK